ncbi:hypothetical protein FJV23_13930 [Acinetobacter baumannii]|nr:hypothetical protein FJV23_13930 [Acinetobacter baumannii]
MTLPKFLYRYRHSFGIFVPLSPVLNGKNVPLSLPYRSFCTVMMILAISLAEKMYLYRGVNGENVPKSFYVFFKLMEKWL